MQKELFKVDLQRRLKQAGESWGDYEDAISSLVDKAYPDFKREAKDVLALNKFLGELKDPQIALAVKQLRPTTVAEAVQATIEFESFLAARVDNGELLLLAVTNLRGVPDAVQSVT